jgi:UDP-N-acetylmuramoylalanine--D-glutamate ligase
MKALVLGLGVSGKSAALFLKRRGVEVVGVDDRTAPQQFSTLRGFDLFVPSPGISRQHPLYQLAKREGIPIKGEMQLFLEETKEPCIGVTGTNGKTTVVRMIEHGLNYCGKVAHAVGNVGVPIAEHERTGILVIEMSSYQLETLTAPVLDVAIVLNIAQDHVERYENFEEYALTKASIAKCLKAGGELLIHSSVDPKLFSQPFVPFEGGNLQAAQLACAHFGVEKSLFRKAMETFKQPLHRIEFVASIEGVDYYNDSKATNVAAVLNAIEKFEQKIVLILGGYDKGLSFEPLFPFASKFSSVVTYGQAREKIANALKHLVEVDQVGTLKLAVEFARSKAKRGEVVLFSPGCSSFDAFKNYEERGDAFKDYVRRR